MIEIWDKIKWVIRPEIGGRVHRGKVTGVYPTGNGCYTGPHRAFITVETEEKFITTKWVNGELMLRTDVMRYSVMMNNPSIRKIA